MSTTSAIRTGHTTNMDVQRLTLREMIDQALECNRIQTYEVKLAVERSRMTLSKGVNAIDRTRAGHSSADLGELHLERHALKALEARAVILEAKLSECDRVIRAAAIICKAASGVSNYALTDWVALHGKNSVRPIRAILADILHYLDCIYKESVNPREADTNFIEQMSSMADKDIAAMELHGRTCDYSGKCISIVRQMQRSKSEMVSSIYQAKQAHEEREEILAEISSKRKFVYERYIK